jgi:hypothetical protein
LALQQLLPLFFNNYKPLWEWSVNNPKRFWNSITEPTPKRLLLPRKHTCVPKLRVDSFNEPTLKRLTSPQNHKKTQNEIFFNLVIILGL